MSPLLHALTTGWTGVTLSYTVVLISSVKGLRKGGAPKMTLMCAPLLAIALFPAVAIVVLIGDIPLHSLGVGNNTWLKAIYETLFSIPVAYAAGQLIAARTRSPTDKHHRGAVVTDVLPAQRTRSSHHDNTGALDPDTPLTLAGISIAPQDETKHFKLIGTTGTGKSTGIRELLETALARGDRAVIADPDGGYADTFYDAGRGDVILNPFDALSAKWSLLSEIQNDYDVEQVARSLIPDNGDPDRTWNDYARTFLAAVVQRLVREGVKDDREVERLLTQAPIEELRKRLTKTSAAAFVAEGNEKMFGSVRSITTSALHAVKYAIRLEGAPFSIRAWVSNGAARQAGGQGGVLFLPYKASEIAALRTLISAWMRLAIFEAMNRAEGDQRLWFIVDELDALGAIDGLKDALARLRKFGGRSVLGFQSIAQVSSTYGKGTADTLVENCGNTLLLRCSGSEYGGTSEFASKLIGQREVGHTLQSITRRPGHWRTTQTSSEHVKIEPAVLASEIERLPDLAGYLKLASTPDWKKVTLIPTSNPTRSHDQQRPTPPTQPTAPQPAPQTAAPPTTPFATPPPGSTRPAKQLRKRTRKPPEETIPVP